MLAVCERMSFEFSSNYDETKIKATKPHFSYNYNKFLINKFSFPFSPV